MSENHYDIAVVGGGPAGSSAAWQAARTGARVVLVDKAEFPRDKPCGDGLTARAVSYLQKMGLANEVAQFHRVDGVRVDSGTVWELTFPRRPGMPNHGHVVRRPELDTLLLKHAESAGVEVRQSTEAVGPIGDGDLVKGVEVKTANGSREKISADAVIVADGAYSPFKRAMNIDSEVKGYTAIAIRAEMAATREDSNMLDIDLRLFHQQDALPGYGWVFPLGGGRINVGIGYVNSYRNWQDVNAADVLDAYMKNLPAQWELPDVAELRKNKSVRAWRLPMGFVSWPPWRPGVLFVGDALGAGKPVSGAGISKALESGLTAGECAVAALQNNGPGDFTNFEQRMYDAWGREYRRGRMMHRALGNPWLCDKGIKLMDNSTFRENLLKVLYKQAQGPGHRH
ncbi:MAG: geranylgeranyl reductase family protein [Mycobacterium sp.]